MKQSSGNSERAMNGLTGLPSSLETERLVLGCLLNGAAFDAVDLSIDAFSAEIHRITFTAIAEVHRRGLGIDHATVAEHLRQTDRLSAVGGLGWLVDLSNGTPQLPHPESYARTLRELSWRRTFAQRALRLVEHSLLLEAEPSALTDEAAVLSAPYNGAGHMNEQPPALPSWPVMSEDAFHGIAGELVRAIEPHSEADPCALLLQFLIGWGSLAGRGPYYLAEAARHYTNEFAVIVGVTSKGRKGTSWGRVLDVLRAVDEYWTENRQLAGLGSGEALIDAANEEDRRTLITEEEFARLLAVISREGSTISANLRSAWQSGTLELRTRQNKVKVTGAHASVIAHITREELLRRLDSTEMMNGLGNRILWCCARRSKVLPFGGGEISMRDIPERLRQATQFARKLGNTRVNFDAQAHLLWEQIYPELSGGSPGMFGAVTSRAEAHCVRLALISALLDCSEEIGAEHLRAALAIWRYCEASAKFIWGDALGDPDADGILKALRAAGDSGMTRWDIVNLFSRNKKAADIDRALGMLTERGLIRFEKEDTGGRSSTRYRAL
jgi:hypothetical protein